MPARGTGARRWPDLSCSTRFARNIMPAPERSARLAQAGAPGSRSLRREMRPRRRMQLQCKGAICRAVSSRFPGVSAVLATKWPHPVVEIMAGLGQLAPPRTVAITRSQSETSRTRLACLSLPPIVGARLVMTSLMTGPTGPAGRSPLPRRRDRHLSSVPSAMLARTVTKAWPGTGQIPSNGR
ncbi:MAG: hypothetical protein JWP15_3402 [Alphaproteobacteria bacterium]|nr:hypothetical protein [Alphaproteobacteria bacterium]